MSCKIDPQRGGVAWGTAMAIVTIEREDGTMLVAQDVFDASDADELGALLLRHQDHAVTVDFRAARRIEDFVIARLAVELARDPVHVIGMTDHQRRLLRYLRPDDPDTSTGPSRTPDDDVRSGDR